VTPPVRALLPAARADLPLIGGGAALTLGAVLLSARTGGALSLGLLVAITLFLFVVLAFMAFPHVAVAATIPLFALTSALKVFVSPSFGPVKDAVSLAAVAAVAILVVQRASEGRQQRGDPWVAAGVFFLIGLYLLNLGGGMQHDVAWFQGLRLVSEPLLLLLVGLALPQPRRTLRWAMVSLVVTACFVAIVGIAQQVLGDQRLVELGYSYTIQVTHIGGRLRSFGTMEDPFTYAAFLLLALVVVLMWMPKGVLTVIAGTVIAAGLLFAYVRTSAVIAVALVGLWLARNQRATIAVFVLAVAVAAGATRLAASSPATESRTTQAGPSLFLTINGRTNGWKVVLDSPKTWAVGKGVGEVGTAKERATYKISRRTRDIGKTSAVDSGYFALIADVGLFGLVVFLALVGRLLTLAGGALRRQIAAGWLAVGFVTVMLLDAITRDSFTGFPTAFLGMLLAGVAIAAAYESSEEPSKPEYSGARSSAR
jgi:hypothetical protein